jgi:glycosyltransferase involved in cell wall biosynthesis
VASFVETITLIQNVTNQKRLFAVNANDDRKIVLMYANTDWYLYNFRRSLALRIQSLGYTVLMISPDGEFGPRLRALGLRWEPLRMDRGSLRPHEEARLIWRLVQLLRRERPCLIHNFTLKCVVYGSLASLFAGIPHRINAVTGLGYVFTSRDAKARALAPIIKTLMRFALGGRGTRVIVQNRNDGEALVQMGAWKPDLRLIPSSGVDCRRFFPRTRSAASAARKRILFCGRLLWDKGVAEFVEAAGILRGRGLDFIAAGAPDPGNPAAVPIQKIREWESLGLAQFPGHVEDMRGLFAETDIFVLPSYREGLPRSLIEAGACGLPLVATDVPGCKDVITDGQDGLLVPARDAHALANAIWRLAENNELARKLGMAARERVVRSFDETIVIERTLDVYQELIPGFRAGGAVNRANLYRDAVRGAADAADRA